MSTDGPVVLVTGGAYGIGRAIVRRFTSEGATVLFGDINRERGNELASQIENAQFFEMNVCDEQQVSQFVRTAADRFGRIDVVCNNAGIERYKRADEYSSADWSAIIDTNLRGGFLMVKNAYPWLRQSKGSVVFISSVQAIANEPHISVYAASKAGILGMVRGMAVDFAADGVRVNAVCPGATMTGMMEKALESESKPESALASIAAAIPLRSIGSPDDIANAAYFLASAQAAYITGTCLVVDGGLSARLSL